MKGVSEVGNRGSDVYYMDLVTRKWKLYVVVLGILHNIAPDTKEDVDFIETITSENNGSQHMPTEDYVCRSGQETRRFVNWNTVLIIAMYMCIQFIKSEILCVNHI